MTSLTKAEQFTQKCLAAHPDKDPEIIKAIQYKGSGTKLEINCTKHGLFYALPQNILTGSWCNRCGIEKVVAAKKSIFKGLRAKFEAKPRPNEDYSCVTDINSSRDLVTINCIIPGHGQFTKTYQSYMEGVGCPRCTSDRLLAERKAKVVAPKQKPAKAVYVAPNVPQRVPAVRPGVPVRSAPVPVVQGPPPPSKVEALKEMAEVLSTFTPCILGPHIIPEYGSAVDLYFPEKRVAIVYVNFTEYVEIPRKEANYQNKVVFANSVGINLIYMYEDEWVQRREIVMARMKSILGTDRRIFARKTKIANLEWSEMETFLNDVHIQGSSMGTNINLCLREIETNEIVAVMTFSGLRFETKRPDTYELIRYCSKGTVVGGFSKLMKEFVRVADPVELISYSNKRWGKGNVYATNGFRLDSTSAMGYFWMKDGTKYNRVKFQKHKLHDVLDVFDPNKTEAENCNINGYQKIWDCGQDKWILKLREPYPIQEITE